MRLFAAVKRKIRSSVICQELLIPSKARQGAVYSSAHCCCPVAPRSDTGSLIGTMPSCSRRLLHAPPTILQRWRRKSGCRRARALRQLSGSAHCVGRSLSGGRGSAARPAAVAAPSNWLLPQRCGAKRPAAVATPSGRLLLRLQTASCCHNAVWPAATAAAVSRRGAARRKCSSHVL